MNPQLKISTNHHLVVLVLAISFLLPACQNQKSKHGALLGLGLSITKNPPAHLPGFMEYVGLPLEFVEEPKAQALLAQQYEIVEGKKLNSVAKKHASSLYQKYCALCHGKNREGYSADNAPSLRSHSLMSVTKIPAANYNFLRYTIAYGRQGTAMTAYAKDQGGPLEYLDIDLLITWLREKSGVKKPIELSTDPVSGDVAHRHH